MNQQPGAEADARLLADLRADRPGAFRQLFDAHWPLLYKVALARLGSAADAEDAAIEAFADAARHIGSFRGESSLGTWLVRLCLSRVGRILRRRGRETALNEEELDQQSGGADPAERAEQRRAFVELAGRIVRLPRAEADAVSLCCLVGLDEDEAARALGITRRTLLRRRQRGLARLRSELAQEKGRHRPQAGESGED